MFAIYIIGTGSEKMAHRYIYIKVDSHGLDTTVDSCEVDTTVLPIHLVVRHGNSSTPPLH